MTRKHFQALAQMFKRQFDDNSTPVLQIKIMANEVADVCQSCNDRFDRQKFLEACGL